MKEKKIKNAKKQIKVIENNIIIQQKKIIDELAVLKIKINDLKVANKELNSIISDCGDLRSVILPGYNGNYTFREDGTMVYNPTGILKSLRKGTNYRLSGNGKHKKTVALRTLMKIHFNGVKCITEECTNFVTKLNKLTCSSCRESYYSRKYARQLVYHKEQNKKITRFYVSRKLGFLKGELPDDLYEHYKKTLLFKREIANKHKIHINKLN